MSMIRPFTALRPQPDNVDRVSAVPYDVVNTEEARAMAADNALSFLHVSRAEIDLPPSADPYSDAVYAKALENFQRLRAEAPLVVEEAPSLYFYRLRMGTHEQTGLAACYSVDEYDAGTIKKHEKTRRDKEDDRTRHIGTLRAQTGPVFLTYRASAAVDAIASRVTAGAPLFDFESADRVRHTVWRASGADVEALVQAFAELPCLYIADGHHRAASAARTRKHLAGLEPGVAHPEADWMLAVAFPDNQTAIMPYNRVVKDLGTYTPETLLAGLREKLRVVEGAASPAAKGEVSMYLAGRWYTIALQPPEETGDVGSTLDVSLLQAQVLTPFLGIGDPRTDKRIDFVGGIRGTGELERLVREGKAAVAFSMFPVGVDDLMRIADAGEIMPPKSTWFEPKLRDGLLSHLI
ncbi:MAG: DUF1015 domain-containing protein [Acidobacteria bacterium]|nr:DUF1015 domain-containing protein [Acidobacteriota bacterium]